MRRTVPHCKSNGDGRYTRTSNVHDRRQATYPGKDNNTVILFQTFQFIAASQGQRSGQQYPSTIWEAFIGTRLDASSRMPDEVAIIGLQ